MSFELVGQAVTVGVVCAKSGIQPKWFLWGSRRHIIQETCSSWHSKEGDMVFTHFSVSDGSAVYELVVNHKTLQWRLESLYVE